MISTHVLDTSRGKPAAGLAVLLEATVDARSWTIIGRGMTDVDGRVKQGLTPQSGVGTGTYRLRFDTNTWFRAQDIEAYYPEVQITFSVRDAALHHHVPLLLSPFGFTTYRGS